MSRRRHRPKEFKTDVPQEEQPNHQHPKNSKLGTTKEIYPRYQKDVGQPAEQLSEFSAETDVALTTSKQKNKFYRLLAKQKPRKEIQSLEPKKVMHNLSKHHFDKAAQSVLAKGFDYEVALTRIPVEDIICGVESSISRSTKMLRKK
ncbi:hypothetical protein ILUMI_20813 [Ignelater luminosus]|uniref:Uncharacterized protein n=1 Tax=Ignelater luminosus TaxID=2038154 RepID=A0A8K0G484_IGNLU|nr:hypothetical protein ILUMI_20813 [Ignelater luminosus]